MSHRRCSPGDRTVLTEGEVGLLAGSVVDSDGNLDPSTILWTTDGGARVGFGDSTLVDSAVTGFQDGAYSLTLAASDQLGAPSSASTTLTVTNVAPTITSYVVTDGVAEGSTVGLNAVFFDPGTFDTHTATVDWAYPSSAVPVSVDGAADLVSTTHVYPQDGTYDVRLCITDDDDTTCQTTQISVVNVAPTVDSVSGGSIIDGGTFDLTATFSDPGADTFAATIDWENDGVDDELIDPATSPITSSHSYPGVGVYTVEVCVFDGLATGCATNTVDVTEFNQAPIAIDDFATVAEGTGDRVLEVLGNDNDPESGPLTIVSNTDPGTGDVACSASRCTFNAPGGFVGTTTFDYTISDGEKQDTATVTIDVVGCVDLTGAFAESNVTVTGYEWIECAHPGASDTAGADLTPLLVPDGTLAQLTTGLASESYGTPGEAADENLGQQFRGAFDASVLRLDLDIPIDTNCLAFDVVFASEEYPDYVSKPYNDGFLAELGASTWSVSGSTIVAPDNFAFDGADEYISVKGSFFDPGRVVTDTAMAYNGSTAVLMVRTPVNAGPNSLFLSVFDGADASESSAALIEHLQAFQSNECNPGAGQPPIAVDDAYTVNEDSPTQFDVVANDDDPEGAAVTIFDVVTPPQHGTVVPSADRTSYTYIPAYNYYGPDSFEYSITDVPNASESDPVADVSIARVTVQVDEMNDVPNAYPDSAAATGSSVTIDVLSNDYDADTTDRISVLSHTDPLFGTVTCTTSCTYTPTPGYDGPDRFTYTIIDSVLPGSEDPALAPRGATDTTTVYINSVIPPDNNIPPVADAGGPYTADACPMGPCLPTELDGSGSYDPDGTYVTYSWFVAPSPPASLTGADSVSPGFVTSENGSFQVYLIVYDANGAWDWDSTSASAFAATVGSAGGSSNIDEGSYATATVDFFNPGGDLTTTIDWGDGSGIETIDFSIFPVTKTHLYPQDGNFPLEICVRGVTVDGPVDLCDSPTLVVDNVVPAVDAGVDRSLVIGGTLLQNRMSFVDPGADAPWTANVDWGDGSPATPLVVDDATGLISMPVGHVYPTAGLYTVTVCVVDDDGPGCDTFAVNVSANVQPVADGGGPYSVAEGDTVALDGSGSVDSDGTVSTWIWQSADPRVSLTGTDTEFPYFSAADNGDFEVTLRVCDNGGACSDVVTTTVTVTNEVPVVAAGSDLAVGAGASAVLAAMFTDSGTADTHAASVDWGDGTVEPGTLAESAGAGTVDGTHTYGAPGVFTVQVCVTDDDLGVGCDSTTVSVSNEPPDALDDDAVTDEDTPVVVTVLGNDTDPENDALAVTDVSLPVNGTAVVGLDGTVEYTPNANFFGSDSFTYTISDGWGGTDTATVTVAVNDVNDGPAAVIAGASTVVEGSTMVLDGGGSSDVDGTIVAYAWSVSSGAVLDDAGVVSPMLTGVDDATVTVTLTVFDDDGATASVTHEVSVTNADPVLSPIGAQAAVAGEEFRVSTSFSDAGALDTHVASVDWGDGTASSGGGVTSPFDSIHWYSAPGTYNFTVTVIDDDGGRGTVIGQVVVVAVDVNLPPVLDPIGDLSVDELQLLTFTATATDGDVPPDTLRFSLVGQPAGAYINSVSGVFTWAPTEESGPGTYTFDVVVTDFGTPRLEDRETVTVTVNEVNTAPLAHSVTRYVGAESTGVPAAVDPSFVGGDCRSRVGVHRLRR